MISKKRKLNNTWGEYAPLYGKVGRPSLPIRTIVGLLFLKQMCNLEDETVVERYMENP